MRKIHILMEPKEAKDNPEILKNLAEVFKQEDIFLSFCTSHAPEKTSPESKELENKVLEEAGEMLEAENAKAEEAQASAPNSKKNPIPSAKTVEESKKGVSKWLKKVSSKEISFGMRIVRWALDIANDISNML